MKQADSRPALGKGAQSRRLMGLMKAKGATGECLICDRNEIAAHIQSIATVSA